MEEQDNQINKDEREMETKKNKDKEETSREHDKARDGIILDKLKNQSEARMGFDRWVYERINKLEKIGKQQEE